MAERGRGSSPTPVAGPWPGSLDNLAEAEEPYILQVGSGLRVIYAVQLDLIRRIVELWEIVPSETRRIERLGDPLTARPRRSSA